MHHAPLLIDIAGTELTADDRRRLQHPLVGGIIYFGRNWHSRAQITALSASIKALRPDLLIAIDHEGGRVQRLRSDGFTHLPPMRTLGQMWRLPPCKADPPGTRAQHAMRAATACGYVLAAELRACGIDLSFTPVLDLDYGASTVIGDRALDANPHITTTLARSLIHGLLQAGMAACGKHFPGHGHVKADSHTAIPIDKRSRTRIMQADALPYAWLGNMLGAVMPAHVIYPQVDPRPAGFSRIWLQHVLRDQLGFTGCIISDDLSMQGARQIEGRALSMTEGVLAALHAGCDMALLCNQSLHADVLETVLDGVSTAIAQGHYTPPTASAHRRHALLPTLPAPDWDTLMHTPAYLQAQETIRSIEGVSMTRLY